MIIRGVTVHQISCVIHGIRSSSLASSAFIVFPLFCFPLIIPASDLASLSCFCFHFYSWATSLRTRSSPHPDLISPLFPSHVPPACVEFGDSLCCPSWDSFLCLLPQNLIPITSNSACVIRSFNLPLLLIPRQECLNGLPGRWSHQQMVMRDV